MLACNVCLTPYGDPIFESAGETSITSLCEVVPGRTEVYFCTTCGHLNTRELIETSAYYDNQYRILIDSEDEDQLYQVGSTDVQQIFRCQHQANTLLSKLRLPQSARLLDFGCAKASTLRYVMSQRPDIAGFAFDVSRMYVPFWERFLESGNWATYEAKREWAGSFDAVMTYFALEHVTDPNGFVQSAAALLKDGGILYGVVPNVYRNLSDFLVVDHINHFSAASLYRLLADAGLSVQEIDESSHNAAFIFVAQKRSPTSGCAASQTTGTASGESAVPPSIPDIAEVLSMADYWREYGSRVREFESSLESSTAACIYGSGFYGTSIAANLRSPERIACFVDRNPFRQGKELFGRPILAPTELPESISSIFVGLNPTIAHRAISEIEDWSDRIHSYCFP